MGNSKNFPEAFLKRMQHLLDGEYESFIQSLQTVSPTSIRLNPFKPITTFAAEERIPWCEDGKYLRERPSFTFDPFFHAGTYYVQEASSMFIEQVWKQMNFTGERPVVLDMCAAPGGKSTHLLSLMNRKGLLVSNEVIPGRNKILQQNIIKWGTANCIVTQNNTKDFASLREYFDIILVDAPCSGEGLFRKDADTIDEWSERSVALCALRQKEILADANACLKPGGYLIYSTCTFEPEENDHQVEAYGLPIANLDLPDFGQVRTKYGYQFYPHKVKGEGFYLAVIQKQGEAVNKKPGNTFSKTQNPKLKTSKFTFDLSNYLENSENFTIYVKDNMLFAIPKTCYPDFLWLEEHLYLRHAGVFMGTLKGRDFQPSHNLALSVDVKKTLPSVELNKEDAISYLRSESPKLKTALQGWCLATYQHFNLGWMKVIPGRVNNYFPKDWRILKQAP